MSWFGGGSKEPESSSASKDFTSDDATSAGYGAAENIMHSGAGSSSSSGAMELQQAGIALQQQLLVQQVISDLTDKSYEKCVTSRPSETLSGTQVACIKATVNKWLDTNEFLTGRLAKKQQMAQQQAQF